MPSRESHSSSSSIFRMVKLMTLTSSSPLIHMIKLLSLVLFFTTATQVTCRLSNETDRLALLSFKELIAEDPLGLLSSWNNSLDLCKWDGVTCNRKHRRVVVLDLRGKSLSGIMSPFLGNLSFLRSLYLQNNIFQGKIPLELGLLFRLQHLNLSFNSLQGEIPTNLSKDLTAINLKSNNLVGKIPTSFGSLSKLTYLNLCTNKLIGGIPPSLGNLSLLWIVDLGVNSITGTIPYSIGLLPNLRAFSIGMNKLSGEVPLQGAFRNSSIISLVGNKGLCGGIAEMQLAACPKSMKGNRLGLKFIVTITCAVVVGTLIQLLAVFLRKRKQKDKSTTLSSLGDDLLRVSYDELMKATDGFSSSTLIGVGSFGTVYKGVLPGGGKPIAIKVLNHEQIGASKSFMAECEAFRKTRHRNVLKIITVCSSVNHAGDDFKALVFEYMPNGSLEDWLHSREVASHQERNLSLSQRLNIAIDVACALEYLHRHCETPIVHCDLKPGNILIDEDMTARVGDFGLAKFLTVNCSNSDGGQTNSLAIKGSIGYVAPEYGIGWKTSIEGDVYSYGILLLEMLTGKRPTNELFTNGQSLHEFSMLALPESVMEIVDSRMPLEEPVGAEMDAQNDRVRQDKIRSCLISLVRIGFACSAQQPSERMNFKDVIVGLMTIKEVFTGVGIHGRKQLRMQHAGEGTSRASE